MASDVAEFLWSKFLKSLAELESELSGTITIPIFKSIKNLMSDFKAIKDVVNESDIMPERYTYSETIDLLYDLNDALAECRIFAHECKELNKNLLSLNFPRIYFVRSMKSRLKIIKDKLQKPTEERIVNPVGTAGTLPPSEPAEQSDMKMGAPQQEIGNPLEKLRHKVFGFDEESKEIECLLLKGVPLEGGSSSSSSGGAGASAGALTRAVGIVGIAGVGKTTLVRKVLESQRVKDKFEHILWLPFSGMREGEQQYSKLRFETCIFDNSGVASEGRIVGLDKLLEKLGQLLSSGKSYLIVLDDVCRKHVNIMERLCSGLPKHNGGAVIVTTRLKQVAQKLGEQHIYSLVHVKPLEREICWRIFEETIKNHHVDFAGFSLDIAKEIKDQCHGLPSVAKTLAQNFRESAPSVLIKMVLHNMQTQFNI